MPGIFTEPRTVLSLPSLSERLHAIFQHQAPSFHQTRNAQSDRPLPGSRRPRRPCTRCGSRPTTSPSTQSRPTTHARSEIPPMPRSTQGKIFGHYSDVHRGSRQECPGEECAHTLLPFNGVQTDTLGGTKGFVKSSSIVQLLGGLPEYCSQNLLCSVLPHVSVSIPGSSDKRPPENEGKINTSQAEPVAANSRAVGQFLSISWEAFR